MTKAIAKRRSIDDVAAEILKILDRPDPLEAVRSTAQAIAQARDAGGGGLRQQYLREAQRHMKRIDPSRHGRELQQLQGQVLALQGRGGDTQIAHVTPREMVIPRSMQTPEFMQVVAAHARRAGVDPRTLMIGSRHAKVNPSTGHQEFQDEGMPPKLGPEGIDDPSSTFPDYKYLGFDPKGLGERWTALKHPVAAYRGKKFADQAWKETVERYPGPDSARHNTEGDAFRHARWSQLMTQSFGPEIAKRFTDAHEITAPNDESEHLMDLYNNQIGRGLPGGEPEWVEEAIKKGLLRTSPFKR